MTSGSGPVTARQGSDLVSTPTGDGIQGTSNNTKGLVGNQDLVGRIDKLQAVVTEVKADVTEVKEMQKQALDRLAKLQDSIKALRIQTYELHEYPIPRLFIVLPEDDDSPWNPTDFFANKFRLHFLCECGEHTGSTSNEIPDIHRALHDGYEITQPKAFFQKYGTYVLWILKVLQGAISVGEKAVPGLPAAVGTSMGIIIEHYEKVSEDDGGAMIELTDQMGSKEALEGADLRQLELFLRSKDEDRVLGNLYRTVTEEGHVKWVCIEHYRKNYQLGAANAFRGSVEDLNGSFDESKGRVEVTLSSKTLADQFYGALKKAKGVYELRIVLNWRATHSDLRRLKETLNVSSVRILELDLAYQEGAAWDYGRRSERYDPVFEIMRSEKIQSFTIVRPHDDFVRRTYLLSPDKDFTHLKHLKISLNGRCWDPAGVKSLVSKAPSLSSLVLDDSPTDLLLPVYIAIAKHQAYPITFNSQSLCIPAPKDQSQQSMGEHHYMARLLEVDSDWIESMEWSKHEQGVVDAFAKATKSGSKLKGLKVLSTDRMLSDGYTESIASIVASSNLQRLEIALKADKRRARILESIQWEYLRKLMIETEGDSLLTALRALANGVTNVSGTPVLKEFRLYHSSISKSPLSTTQDDLLRAFVTSTLLKELRLELDMTFKQVLALIQVIDVSELAVLELRANSFRSTEVDMILDELQDAKLSTLYLGGATITKEQRGRMEAKGTSFRS